MAKVLVVDDDASIRFLFCEELLADGHRVSTAADGPTALVEVEQHAPDVVILDIKMPGMNGLEVLRHLKLEHPALPVLLVTAYEDFREAGAALGADGYFIKSANLLPLKAAVRRLTEVQAGPAG